MSTTSTLFHNHNHHANRFLSRILPTLSNKNDLIKIDLVDSIIILRGSSREATGRFLRGVLELKLEKPMKISKLEMKFIGRTKVTCPEIIVNEVSRVGTEYIRERKELITHYWEFVNNNTLSSSSLPVPSTSTDQQSETTYSNNGNNKNNNKKYKNLFRIKKFLLNILNLKSNNNLTTKTKTKQSFIMVGTHSFPFEVYIPGNLPESIQTSKGSVNYKLVAKLSRKRRLLKVSRRICYVEIVRILHDREDDRGIGISRDLNDMLSYEISIPKKSFILGQIIPIEIKLTPLTKKLKIHCIKVQLIERIIYKPKRKKFEEISASNTLTVNDLDQNSLLQDHDEGDIGNLVYNRNISFSLPRCSGPINYSCKTPLIDVSHELQFIFIVTLPFLPFEKTRLQVNQRIRLLSCMALEDFVYLPNYRDNSMYCPCHPEYQRMSMLILGEDNDPSEINCTHDNNQHHHYNNNVVNNLLYDKPPPAYDEIIN